MPRDLHELPKLRDSLSYIYVEKAIVERDENAIVLIREGERVAVPISSVTVLLLGPGTSITHAAVRIIAQSGCLAVWCGENGLRFYASGTGETRSSERLLRQAALCMDENAHMEVVRRMYDMRFPGIQTQDMSLRQIRGLEGVRVRETYKRLSKTYGIEWHGRQFSKEKWDDTDPVNVALSMANVCLYGICHAAIVSLGYSPALGFIHTGLQTSFVYDIADLYKMETSVPAAFEAAAHPPQGDFLRGVRVLCRQKIRQARVLKRIAEDLEKLFDVPVAHSQIDAENEENYLWEDVTELVRGGQNFARGDMDGG